MADGNSIDRDLQLLESELRRLEAEYNMYFAGRLPRPPVETRRRVQTLVRTLDRQSISNYGVRFRFTTLQSRFQSLCDLWDRGLRAREEGRGGPFAGPQRQAQRARQLPPDTEAFRDPARELDKLRRLHERLTADRLEAGEGTVPFHEFAARVRDAVRRQQARGSDEVAVRVTLKDGAVSVEARDVQEAGEG
ncbi:MAG TPA: hypothetical protein VF198_18880 [Vicinamibacterales bacterium]